MKHLKSYQIFESSDDNIRAYANDIDLYESIKDFLKNIFLELEDEGFDINIEGRWMRTSEFEELTGFEVKIKKSSTSFPYFLLENIYEYILTCKSYLKDNGFFITDINGIEGAGPQSTYGLDYGIGLHESDPRNYKLFDKPLIKLEFKIRKEK